jgi:hypothetical protein
MRSNRVISRYTPHASFWAIAGLVFATAFLSGCGGGSSGGGSSSHFAILDCVGDNTITAATTSLWVTFDNPDAVGYSLQWSLLDGPATQIALASPHAATSECSFPLNGSYDLRMRVVSTDGAELQRDITITVSDADPHHIDGTISDVLDTNAVSGQTVQLRWLANGIGSPVVVAEQATAGDGGFAFAGLIGDIDDFSIATD